MNGSSAPFKKMGDGLSGAIFSGDMLRRYQLWRMWDATLPVCNLLMLNPSTADHEKNDPTINRGVEFAKMWGCGALDVTNLFSWRATHPEGLLGILDPVGEPHNDAILRACAVAAEASLGYVVTAWGNHGKLHGRADAVRTLLRDLGVRFTFLRRNESGEPSHPLYLPAWLKPMEWPT